MLCPFVPVTSSNNPHRNGSFGSIIIYPLGTLAEGLRVWPGLHGRSAQHQDQNLRCLLCDSFPGTFGLVAHLSDVSAQLSVLTGPPNMGPLRFTGWNPTPSQNLRSVKSHQQNRILSRSLAPSMHRPLRELYKLQRTFTCILSLDSITILGRGSKCKPRVREVNRPAQGPTTCRSESEAGTASNLCPPLSPDPWAECSGLGPWPLLE